MIFDFRSMTKSITALSRFLLIGATLLCSQILLADEIKPVRFGVLSIAQPSRIHLNWQPFADYMSKQLGRPIELVVPRGFGKMKKAISNGEVDFFYINSHVFYRLKDSGKAEAIAQMQNISGGTTSHSDFFVRSDSGIKKLDDIRGKKIAYVSPMGAGGYLAPRAQIYNSGVNGQSETREVFTKNLSNSIYGVLLGDYDVATMCGVNYTLLSKKIDTGQLSIIASSDAYPENVVGARPDIPAELKQDFKNALLSMDDSEEGRTLLQKMQSMKIKNFVAYDESIEAITKKLLQSGHLE